MKIAGMQNIKTAIVGGLQSLPRTGDGSLDELAQLMRQKARLLDERENWQRRIDRIDARLARIAAMEESCQQALAGKDAELAAQAAEEEAGHKEKLGEVLMRY